MSKRSRSLLLVFLGSCLFLASPAQAQIYIKIDQSSEARFPVAIAPLQGSKDATLEQIDSLLQRNLSLAGYFDLVPRNQFLADPAAAAVAEKEIDFSIWQAVGAKALIKGKFTSKGKSAVIEWRLYDTDLKTQLVGKEYTFAKEDAHKVVHKFANEVVLALTGARGIFDTQIAAACGPQGKRQLYTFYPDGTGKRLLTSIGSNHLSPTWSPTGDKLAYTAYTQVKKRQQRPDLYLYSFATRKAGILYQRGSLSISPAFSPDGASVAVSNTQSGDAELYLVDLRGNLLSRLTNSWSIDVSPSWSPDGSQLVFASERAGRLHLFKMGRSGATPTRLTYVGYQNDQPDWAPTGDKIAFTSRDQGAFDIFIMNPDGSNIQRLTRGEGDNEHPTWSPDGRYLTFSSTRTGSSQIYLMTWDGSNPQLALTDSCVNPAWSPWMN